MILLLMINKGVTVSLSYSVLGVPMWNFTSPVCVCVCVATDDDQLKGQDTVDLFESVLF